MPSLRSVGLATLLWLAACAPTQPNPTSPARPPSLQDDSPQSLPGLDNVVAYAPAFYSGSVPHGDAGFDSLVALGVGTVISVDGAAPDLARARSRGLRYVHLPIGYDGMSDERALELARAVSLARDEGPVYLHCHHGMHRSAGAAGSVAVSLGWLDNAQAEERMLVSGTSPSYPGLYACVARAQLATPAQLAAMPREFPERHPTSDLVAGMVAADVALEHLRAIEAAGWQVPSQHPDLVPAAEAGQLTDVLRVLLADDPEVQAAPEGFRAMLGTSVELGSELEEALLAGRGAELSERFAALRQSCQACHAEYRD